VDGKGRVLIPQSLRDVANLKQGEKVVLEFDSQRKAIVVEPAHEKKLLRLRILLADTPGSLAAAAWVLAKMGVDLVSTQSHSSRRGEAAEWEVECNPGGKSVSEIKAALAKAGARLSSSAWE
jgi:bifunctional DNA-binding transcriptional regulator/antitoxin component of YhaV-PrlF toxin-antitoxin module